MELLLILIHGTFAGLAAGTLSAIVLPIFVRDSASPPWRSRSIVLDISVLLVHAWAGAVLSVLFWLSWGLTAIVDVAWWQRGLSFGLLSWLALSAPLLLTQMLATRIDGRTVAKSACDWLLTCVLVGLACAWSWSNGR